MCNTYKALTQEDGSVWAVSLMGEEFDQEAIFGESFLACPAYRFLTRGDGLIVIHALDGTAVYGELGPAEGYHIPAVRATLLQVGPGMVDQVVAQGEEPS